MPPKKSSSSSAPAIQPGAASNGMHIHSAGKKGGSLAAAATKSSSSSSSPSAAAVVSSKPKADAAKGDGKAATIASEDVQPLLLELYTAPNAEDAAKAAAALADYIDQRGLRVLESQNISASLISASTNKKSALEREAAAIAFQTIAYQCGGKNAKPFALGAEPWLVDLLGPALDLYADKADAVRDAAEHATSAIISLVPPEGAVDVLPRLYAILKDGAPKWQTKVGTLKLLSRLSEANSEQIGEVLEDLIPVLTHSMHETKAEISKQAVKTATKVCQNTLENNDLRPFIPDLVGCMNKPDTVPLCIKKLSSTTFVAEVTGPALAVMVPLLSRALNERNQTVQRSTVIVVENLCKLVRDPREAARFLPALTPGVQRIYDTASFPEVREHAKSALDTLHAALKDLEGAGDEGAKAPESKQEEFATAKKEAHDALIAQLTQIQPEIAQDKWALVGLDYLTNVIARLAAKRIVYEAAWKETYVAPVYRRVLGDATKADEACDALRKHYVALDEAKYGKEEEEDEDISGEQLCNIQFSLAYGGLLLLNHTTLRLHRGHRYGIVATNGSGKSTLLKAMRDGKVEGYPTQDVLRTIMVEHSLQGEDGSIPILNFVMHSPGIEGKPEPEVYKALLDVGFDDERQQNPVGSLSGGWKMKLELARAMLVGADILLLDEPTNHLDVGSVAWLENYLVSNNNITVLTVSHDSSFLDNICTDIMHYENKKIKYYKGNLSDFVAKKPEAKTFYSLNASVIKFSFPEPGHLMGIRSQTRTILKLSDVTFTYPGMKKPSINHASAAVTLSSRIGVLGPNGAGKSTLIKCLTGEVVPQEGKVEKHPALRVAMMAQHAFHHLEQHLEKTPIQYITWRFQNGSDRELTEKATRKMTSEEEAQMAVPITSKTGETRRVEYLVGRAKLKKSFQYEVKWQGLQHKFNTWIPRERLLELGFTKMVQSFDDFESSREGAGARDLSQKEIRKHLEAIGLNGEIAEHHEMAGLSGGQKVKVVLAAALWNKPQVLVLDEPTNYLDRDTLGGLAVAIKEWSGAVVLISHNMEFVSALCSEFWNVDNGAIQSKTRVAIDEGRFGDEGTETPEGTTPAASRLASKVGTPIGSAAPSAVATPIPSDEEKDEDMSKLKAKAPKKKKMTRNEKKAQEERRRLRTTKWLIEGGEREPDTDDD